MSYLLCAAVARNVPRGTALYCVNNPSLYRFRPAVFDVFGSLPRTDMVSHSVMDLGVPDADTVDIYIHECAQEELGDRVPLLQPAVANVLSELRHEHREQCQRAEANRLAALELALEPPRPYEPANDPVVVRETTIFKAATLSVVVQNDEFTSRVNELKFGSYEPIPEVVPDTINPDTLDAMALSEDFTLQFNELAFEPN